MRIRPSLRLYFFISVVLLGSTMAIGFSVLSVNYFIDGLDKGLNIVMRELAKTTIVSDGQPKDIVGFNVASRWQDTPELIQQRFISAPKKIGQLQKIKEQESIFSMPKNLYFVVLYYNSAGEERFISRVILDKDRPVIVGSKQPEKRFYWAFATALAAIAFFAFFLMMIMQKIAKPIESLKLWAKSLNQNNIQDSHPDFTYNELNVLAALVQNSLISAHQSLNREQRFLSYASHELRTPISVIRSNVDLLKRLSEQSPLSDKQELTLQRIERAGLTMSDLTDTLLWLSRNDEQTVIPEAINLSEKIKQLCNELDYLLNAKHVAIEIHSEEGSQSIAATACHIVLSNLIRNAYQHTQQGQVKITQCGSRVSIINSSSDSTIDSSMINSRAHKRPHKEATMGYGLGLQLSEKIIKRQGWLYEITEAQGYYHVTVDFSPPLSF